jgi:hypothetical protein
LVLAEAYVDGEAYSVDVALQTGLLRTLQLSRRFSMRNLRGTLPAGMAWGAHRPGTRADDDPRWGSAVKLARLTTTALRLDDTFVSLDLVDDGDGFDLIDLHPHVGRGVDRGMVFQGVDWGGWVCDVVTQRQSQSEFDFGAIDRGFAARFFYPSAQGQLNRVQEASEEPLRPEGATSPSSLSPGWQSLSPNPNRSGLEWDGADRVPVGRPRSVDDRIATAFVEAEDPSTAWMRANEIDPDSLFLIEEAQDDLTLNRPVWPMRPAPSLVQ